MEEQFVSLATEIGLKIICWRTMPKNSSVIGETACSQEPFMRQVFIEPIDANIDKKEFQLKVKLSINRINDYLIRKLNSI